MNPFCHQQGERINYLFLAIKVGSEIINVLNPATESHSKAISYGKKKKNIFQDDQNFLWSQCKTFSGNNAMHKNMWRPTYWTLLSSIFYLKSTESPCSYECSHWVKYWRPRSLIIQPIQCTLYLPVLLLQSLLWRGLVTYWHWPDCLITQCEPCRDQRPSQSSKYYNNTTTLPAVFVSSETSFIMHHFNDLAKLSTHLVTSKLRQKRKCVDRRTVRADKICQIHP